MWLSKKLIVAVVVVLVMGLAGGIALAANGGASGSGKALAADDSQETSGAVLAADESDDGEATTLVGRVAGILGIDEGQLEDAISQARDELQGEALDAYLQKLVDAGKITEEQAQEYKTWWLGEPDLNAYRDWLETQPDLGVRGLGGRGLGPAIGVKGCLPGIGGSTALMGKVAAILGIDEQTVKDAFVQAQSEMRDEALKDRLDALVAEGKITQEQADEYLGWYQSEPDMTPYRQWLEAEPDLGIGGPFAGRGFGGGGMMRGGCGCIR